MLSHARHQLSACLKHRMHTGVGGGVNSCGLSLQMIFKIALDSHLLAFLVQQ